MTPEEIIRLARAVRDGGHWSALDLINFGTLVAAAEREACAALCEARFTGDLTREDMEAKRCAEAIRARGEA